MGYSRINYSQKVMWCDSHENSHVHFWTKIEFLDVVKHRWESQDAVSSATHSWQNRGGSSGGKVPHTKISLFTSGRLINSLK